MGTFSGTRHFPTWSLLAAVVVILLLPTISPAQEPVKSFDQLSTRLKVGDTVWVTDAQGREIKGKIREFGPSALTLDHGGPETIQAEAVRLITERKGRHAGKGALCGLGAGVAFGFVWGAASGSEDCPGASCALLGAGIFGGIGAAAGAAIGAAFPGKEMVVYRAPGASGSARLSLAPVITPRTKGVLVAFSF